MSGMQTRRRTKDELGEATDGFRKRCSPVGGGNVSAGVEREGVTPSGNSPNRKVGRGKGEFLKVKDKDDLGPTRGRNDLRKAKSRGAVTKTPKKTPDKYSPTRLYPATLPGFPLLGQSESTKDSVVRNSPGVGEALGNIPEVVSKNSGGARIEGTKRITDEDIDREIKRMSLTLLGNADSVAKGTIQSSHGVDHALCPEVELCDWKESTAVATRLKDEILDSIGNAKGGPPGLVESIKGNLESLVSIVAKLVRVHKSGTTDGPGKGGGSLAPSSVGQRIDQCIGSFKVSPETVTSETDECFRAGDEPRVQYPTRNKIDRRESNSGPGSEKPRKSAGTIYIEPKANSGFKDLQELKISVLKALNPVKKCLQIRKVVKTRSGGIIIEVGRGEDKRRILGDVDLASLKVTVKESPMLNPRVIIKRAPRSIEGRDLDLGALVECLRKQNFENEVNLGTEAKLLYRTGPKSGEYCNLVIEVNPRLRALLTRSGWIYIGSYACKVEDHLDITRCFKCQGFGHIARTCRQKEFTCGHCGVIGHCFAECTKSEEPPSCPNCIKINIKGKAHFSRSRECPAFIAALGRIRDRINYGI